MVSQRNIPVRELAYMAGYFDGEGCITLTKQNRGRNEAFRIAVVSRDFASLLSFAKYFGGKIRTHRQSYKDSPRLYWAWYSNGSKAQDVIRHLLPLLRGKREKAESALTLQFLRNGRMVTKEEKARREIFRNVRSVV